MNDRFKYRCWDKQIKKMRYGDIQLSCSGLPFTLEATSEGLKVVDIDNIEIMQSTGIKDRNGKLIYEGDIVKYTSAPSKSNPEAIPFTENYKIVWNETYGGYNTQRFNGVNCHCIATVQKQIEIVGNVYENPELLEVKND